MKKKMPRHMNSALQAAEALERNPAQGSNTIGRLLTLFRLGSPCRHGLRSRPRKPVEFGQTGGKVPLLQAPLGTGQYLCRAIPLQFPGGPHGHKIVYAVPEEGLPFALGLC